MLGNTLEEPQQGKMVDAPAAAEKAERKKGRYYLLTLIIFCSLLFGITSYIYYRNSQPQGDEPHYLVISQTMFLYHSLDVMRDYNHGDYHAFYSKPIMPHVSPNKRGEELPYHSIGGPALWLIPFALHGRLGAILFISLVSVLIIVLIYEFLLEMGIRQSYAFWVSLAVAIGSPIYVYSHLTFVESVGGLCCIYAIYVLCKKHPRIFELILSGVALGLLPWIHTRFEIVEPLIFIFMLYRLYRDYKFSHLKAYASFVIPVAALFLLFAAYLWFVWGTLNPAPAYAAQSQAPFQIAPWPGLLGTFFDRAYGLFPNFPIFMFALPGIILALRKEYLSFNLLMLLIFIPYMLISTTVVDWGGGWSPPARYLIALIPAWTFYVAYALQRAHNWIVNIIAGIFALAAFVLALAYFGAESHGFNNRDGLNWGMTHLGQIIHVNIANYVPTVFAGHRPPHNLWLFALWVGGCVCLTLVVALWAIMRTRRAPAVA